MKNLSKLSFTLFLATMLTVFNGCKKDDGPAVIQITSVTADGSDLATGNQITEDLNAATASTNVPLDAVITIVFSRDVDANTVSTTSVTLNDGISDIVIGVATSGKNVTVTPTDKLEKGTEYTLSIAATITAVDGGAFVAATRTFTTAGRKLGVIPQKSSLKLYMPFDQSVVDEEGHVILIDDVTFATDRFGNFENSADFNGTTNYVCVEHKTDILGASHTISYWIKLPASADYDAHVRKSGFVTYSIGGNQGSFHEWGRFDCCGFTFDFLKYMTNHVNSGTDGGYIERWNESKQEGAAVGGDLTFDKDNKAWLEDNTGSWLHIVTTYDAAQSKKAIYTNGVLATEFVFTNTAASATGDWTLNLTTVDADANNNRNLYLGAGLAWWGILDADGFTITPDRGGPHAFKGQMDDFRIFDAALTNAEVLELYNAEAP